MSMVKLRVRSRSRFLEAIVKTFEIMNTLLNLCWSFLDNDIELMYEYMYIIGICGYDEYDGML